MLSQRPHCHEVALLDEVYDPHKYLAPFFSLYSPDWPLGKPFDSMRAPAVPDNCVITLSVADVSKTFKQVNIHKAAGPGG